MIESFLRAHLKAEATIKYSQHIKFPQIDEYRYFKSQIQTMLNVLPRNASKSSFTTSSKYFNKLSRKS